MENTSGKYPKAIKIEKFRESVNSNIPSQQVTTTTYFREKSKKKMKKNNIFLSEEMCFLTLTLG